MDTLGYRRKVTQTVDKKLVASEHIVTGLTVFEPGESSAWHNHPASEEVDKIIRGSGTFMIAKRYPLGRGADVHTHGRLPPA